MERQASDYMELSRRSQLQYGKKFIDSLEIDSKSHVLALGCGTGELAAYVARCKVADGKLTAFDPDEERISIAKERFKDVQNISFLVGKANEVLEGKHEEFDLAYSNVAFHWIPVEDRVPVLKCINNSLKPGGISAHQVGEKLLGNIRKMIASSLVKGDDLKCISDMLQLPSKEDFAKMGNAAGFEAVSSQSMEEESKFCNVGQYLAWAEATFHGKIPFTTLYKEREVNVDIGLRDDCSVVEVTSLFRSIMRKPFT